MWKPWNKTWSVWFDNITAAAATIKSMNACAFQTSILNQVKERFETNLCDSQKELITNQKAYENFKAAKTDEIKVDLFQHGDFSGWKAQFGIGSFNLIQEFPSQVLPLETVCTSWMSCFEF